MKIEKVSFCFLKGEMFLFNVIDGVPHESVSNKEKCKLIRRGTPLVCGRKMFEAFAENAKRSKKRKKRKFLPSFLPPRHDLKTIRVTLEKCFLSICLS